MPRTRQTSFAWSTWGGRRPGAGRKRAPANVGLQPHAPRPRFQRHVPVHVTMRAMRGVPAMRKELVAATVLHELARATAKGFRLLHYSVQNDHVHLIAEADDATCLARGMQRLASRIAMRVNGLAARRGRFWRERYHRRDLGTPRQFRNALVYVLFNARKHAGSAAERRARARVIDGLSSGMWADDWASEEVRALVRAARARAGPIRAPVAPPKTWLARTGWKRHGRLDPTEASRRPSP